MSVNMRVFSVGDDGIRASVEDRKRVRDWLWNPAEEDGAELWNRWREIDYVLGLHSPITSGDTAIEEGGSEPIHAIQSSRVPSFADALHAISDEVLRERLDPSQMRDAGLWVPVYPQYVDNIFSELAKAFHELRDVAARAADRGNGLIFCRYESL